MATRTRQEYLKDLATNYSSTTVVDTGQKFCEYSYFRTNLINDAHYLFIFHFFSDAVVQQQKENSDSSASVLRRDTKGRNMLASDFGGQQSKHRLLLRDKRRHYSSDRGTLKTSCIRRTLRQCAWLARSDKQVQVVFGVILSPLT